MATSGPWSAEETRALLDVWGADNVQRHLDGVVRNRTVYQRVANGLAELGFERTWQQCKTKVKNLVQRYRKIKDHNGVSGNDAKSFPYYDRLDEILGTRAASTPPVVVESGEPDDQPSGGAAKDSSFRSVDMSPGPATPPQEDQSTPVPDDTDGPTVPDQSTISVPPMTTIGRDTEKPPNRRELSSLRKRGLKRKHSEEEGLADTLAKVFAKAEEAAGEREERMRRLELEAEERRREAEDRHEERMMRFLAGLMQSSAGGYAHPPYQQGQYQPPPQRPYQPPPQRPYPGGNEEYTPYSSSPETYP